MNYELLNKLYGGSGMNNEEAIRIIIRMIDREIVTGNRGKIEALEAALRALESETGTNAATK